MEKWLITQLFPLFFGAFFITQKLPQVNDCQKTIQYTVETTTTKRDFTQSEKLYTPPMLSDPLSIRAVFEDNFEFQRVIGIVKTTAEKNTMPFVNHRHARITRSRVDLPKAHDALSECRYRATRF